MSTLDELIDLVELELRDTANSNWSTDELTQHIRRALRAYSQVDPIRASAEITLTEASRQMDLSSLAGLLQVTDIWYPYEEDSYPPERPHWITLSDTVIYLAVTGQPEIGQVARVFYHMGHTIEGLDGATATTLDATAEELVTTGAAAYAALQYAQSSINTVTVNGWTPRQLQEWATVRLQQYKEGVDAIRRRRALQADPRVPWAAATLGEGKGGVV